MQRTYPPYYRSLDDDDEPETIVSVKRQYGDYVPSKAERVKIKEREQRLDREQQMMLAKVRSRWQEIAAEEDRKDFVKVKQDHEKLKAEHIPVKAQAEDLDTLLGDNLIVLDTNESGYTGENAELIGMKYKIGGHEKILYLGKDLDSYLDTLETMAKRLETGGLKPVSERLYREAITDGLIDPLIKLTSDTDSFSGKTKELGMDLAYGSVPPDQENVAEYLADGSYQDPKKFAAIVRAFKQAVTRIKSDSQNRISIGKKNAKKVILNAIKEAATTSMKMKPRNLVGVTPPLQNPVQDSPLKEIR